MCWCASTNGVGPWKKRRLKTIAKTHWDGVKYHISICLMRSPYRECTHSHTQHTAHVDVVCTVFLLFFLSISTDAEKYSHHWMHGVGSYVRSFVDFFWRWCSQLTARHCNRANGRIHLHALHTAYGRKLLSRLFCDVVWIHLQVERFGVVFRAHLYGASAQF